MLKRTSAARGHGGPDDRFQFLWRDHELRAEGLHALSELSLAGYHGVQFEGQGTEVCLIEVRGLDAERQPGFRIEAFRVDPLQDPPTGFQCDEAGLEVAAAVLPGTIASRWQGRRACPERCQLVQDVGQTLDASFSSWV